MLQQKMSYIDTKIYCTLFKLVTENTQVPPVFLASASCVYATTNANAQKSRLPMPQV